MKNVIFIVSLLFLLVSCEIVQETRFNPDGSGKYSLSFDLSEMMKMDGAGDQKTEKKQLDTLIVFSELIENKKDSISKLSESKQKKIKRLKNFSFYIKMDSVSDEFKMKINYNFKSIEGLTKFSEYLDFEKFSNQLKKEKDINKLDWFDKSKKSKTAKENELINFNNTYATTFNKKSFSVKIKPQALEEASKRKDTTMTKDNPMNNMVRFKTRYIFPYKIKKIHNNNNAKILADFKGVEISANLFDLNYNPKYFNIDIEFEE